MEILVNVFPTRGYPLEDENGMKWVHFENGLCTTTYLGHVIQGYIRVDNKISITEPDSIYDYCTAIR